MSEWRFKPKKRRERPVKAPKGSATVGLWEKRAVGVAGFNGLRTGLGYGWLGLAIDASGQEGTCHVCGECKGAWGVGWAISRGGLHS